ncbi:MAG: metal ABC transporter ATP-binding protein [Rhodoferax sp.]|nr:MAG: metal ABC transporter ATP-binding protein [Rhodoferax sp.]
MSAPAVVLDNLTVSYRQHPALHHVSGAFAQGSLTAVIGPNGAGKSTLVKSIAGLLPRGHRSTSAALRVLVEAGQMAYLPQQSELDRNFPMRVGDCVLLGVWRRTGAFGTTTPAQRSQVDAALEAVGLQGFAQRPVGTLSSGQMQRVLFARVLVQDAALILLDEPFTAMDSKTTAALLQVVLQWQDQGRTVIAVLHDDAQVRRFFPQTLLLARECIAWGPTEQVLTGANLQRAQAMAEAWDETAALCDLDGTLDGQAFDALLAQKLAHALGAAESPVASSHSHWDAVPTLGRQP